MGIILKDWYGEDHTYDHDTIWVRDTNGGLAQFTKGAKPVLETLTVTENGSYTPYSEGVDGFGQVIVDVEPETNELILNGEFTGFVANEIYNGMYAKELVFGTDIDALVVKVGYEHTIEWDGVMYTTVAKDTCKVIEEASDGSTIYHFIYYLGNGALLDSEYEDTGVPFAIQYTSSKGLTIVSNDTAESHTLGIMKRVRPREALDMMLESITITENGTYTADPIYDGLKQVVVDIAGVGVSDDVRYVTFMSYDGLTEYGKKAVAVGDDCADPIARGIFGTPTRESDVQYNYTHSGWATEPNGEPDANWNKAITEDKTVYAAFASAVRYYTITYYDEDGTTVLKTESLAYGTTPSTTYIPEKEGYGFEGWVPELTSVTGDASYTATWAEKITFANGSWADIAEICEKGEAKDYFAAGDSKTVTLVGGQVLTAKIAGIEHDDLSDGSGKAGISVIFETAPTTTLGYFSYVRNGITTATITNLIPTAIKNVAKSVQKYVDGGKYSGSAPVLRDMTFWVPSLEELGMDYKDVGTSSADYCAALGETYELYSNSTVAGLKRYTSAGGVATYYTRNYFLTGNEAYYYHNGTRFTSESSGTRHVIFGFCI